MLILSLTFLLMAVGALWLTSVHPARNVLRLRRTLVSFFLVLGALSLALQFALHPPLDTRPAAALTLGVSAGASGSR
jgi:hypothetical protein